MPSGKAITRQPANFFASVRARTALHERGKKLATARNLYDFTVSAPKAFSVQALEDPRLIDAHKKAVAEMAAEMERLAGARVRKDGANDTRRLQIW